MARGKPKSNTPLEGTSTPPKPKKKASKKKEDDAPKE